MSFHPANLRASGRPRPVTLRQSESSMAWSGAWARARRPGRNFTVERMAITCSGSASFDTARCTRSSSSRTKPFSASARTCAFVAPTASLNPANAPSPPCASSHNRISACLLARPTRINASSASSGGMTRVSMVSSLGLGRLSLPRSTNRTSPCLRSSPNTPSETSRRSVWRSSFRRMGDFFRRSNNTCCAGVSSSGKMGAPGTYSTHRSVLAVKPGGRMRRTHSLRGARYWRLIHSASSICSGVSAGPSLMGWPRGFTCNSGGAASIISSTSPNCLLRPKGTSTTMPGSMSPRRSRGMP